MCSSFSRVTAFAAIRERWNSLPCRSKKTVCDAHVEQIAQITIPSPSLNWMYDQCQPDEMPKMSPNDATARWEAPEPVDVEASTREEEEEVRSEWKTLVEHTSKPMVERMSPELPEPPKDEDIVAEIIAETVLNQTHSLEGNDVPTDLDSTQSPKSSMTSGPEPFAQPRAPSPIQYTPGGRAIPAVPYSKCRSPTTLKLSYPQCALKGSDESCGNGQHNYTNMTPLPHYQTRRRARYSRPKSNSMANTPISEDEEMSFHASESSSIKSAQAEPTEMPNISESVETSSTRSSNDTGGGEPRANKSLSSDSDESSDSKKPRCPSRAEYIDDSQILSERRLQLKHQQRNAHATLRYQDHQPFPQVRGLTYPPAGTRGMQSRNTYGNFSVYNYGGAPYPQLVNPHPAARRISSAHSLHQRAMLSQWRASMAVETAKQSMNSPWTAQGGAAIAASEQGPLPGVPGQEPWRERRTRNGTCGWGSRGETRLLSGMDAREIEIAHREVLRRMQAGANRHLKRSEAWV